MTQKNRPLVFYFEARGVEQILFENNGGKVKLLNKINPIRPNHKMIDAYLDAGKKVLKMIK